MGLRSATAEDGESAFCPGKFATQRKGLGAAMTAAGSATQSAMNAGLALGHASCRKMKNADSYFFFLCACLGAGAVGFFSFTFS